jgi:hypothetical protein
MSDREHEDRQDSGANPLDEEREDSKGRVQDHAAFPQGLQRAETSDPMIKTGSGSHPSWTRHPDATMVVETYRISEPDSNPPGVYIVPFQENPPSSPEEGREDRGSRHEKRDKRSASSNAGDRARSKSDVDRASNFGSGQDRVHETNPPSMTRMFLYTGLMGLVCGMVGAWGYSYFFGSDKSSKSGDQGSSSKDSGAQKSASGSSKKSSSGSSASKAESGAQAQGAKDFPGFTRADDADILRKQNEHLSERIDRLSERIDKVSRPRNQTPPDVRTLQIKVGDLARTVEDMGDVTARLRRVEDRVEDLGQQLKNRRSDSGGQGRDTHRPPALDPSTSRSTSASPPSRVSPLGTDDGVPTPVGEEPDAALAQGVVLFREGRYPEAQNIFRKLQLTRPADARVWYYSALTHGLTTGDWGDKARELAERGFEQEQSGHPTRATIDSSMIGLSREMGRDWLNAIRSRLVRNH